MKSPISLAALQQHTAVLGMTGGGKTITSKGIVETVVAEGARVCVLDPIKSDWWGMTLAADGKRPGLPFHILGGPYGHVPLHPSAGKSLGQIVATGALPLSIIDMEQFGPGDQNAFFVPFIESLFRNKTRENGVLYLVLEEAHMFCPKERDGTKGESMAVYWVKKIAQASRSKGIRLLVCTQRTQALHNGVLGSCATTIAHRLTLPADKKPVVEWLAGNTSPEIAKEVAASLGSLKVGEAWLCNTAEQKVEWVKFPMIHTYDNSATPDGASDHARPPKVDTEKLRAIVGDSIKEAEANDPKRLRARIVELETAAKGAGESFSRERVAEIVQAERDAIRHQARLDAADGLTNIIAGRANLIRDMGTDLCATIKEKFAEHDRFLREVVHNSKEAIKRNASATPPDAAPRLPSTISDAPLSELGATRRPPPAVHFQGKPVGPGIPLPKAERSILTVLAQRGPCSKRTLALSAGYAVGGGGFCNALSRCRTSGWLEGEGTVRITTSGAEALGPVDPMPTGAALIEHWKSHAGGKAERLIIETLAAGGTMTKAELAERCGYAADGGGFSNALSRLRTLCVIEGSRDISLAVELRGVA